MGSLFGRITPTSDLSLESLAQHWVKGFVHVREKAGEGEGKGHELLHPLEGIGFDVFEEMRSGADALSVGLEDGFGLHGENWETDAHEGAVLYEFLEHELDYLALVGLLLLADESEAAVILVDFPVSFEQVGLLPGVVILGLVPVLFGEYDWQSHSVD